MRLLASPPIVAMLAVCLCACTEKVVVTAETPPSLAELLGGAAHDGFALADQPREFRFPADHGPHESFRNEWWYLTGNLDSSDGRRFGYELTLFRFALTQALPEATANWRTRDVYLAHFAVSDIENQQFLMSERFARGAAGLAGATRDPLRIWLHDWSLRYRQTGSPEGTWQVQAAADGFAIDLVLEALKKPVLQGVDGLSQKSTEPGNASYYYSLPRLRTTGRVRVADREFDVDGLSWLDREWSSGALGARQVGWDWFALQLDNGTDLMIYELRRDDGSADTESAGSLVLPDGTAIALAAEDFSIEVLGTWRSALGGRYPQGWRLRIPSQQLDLEVSTAMAEQEFAGFVRYWEGAVDVAGMQNATPVTGRGYVELTGYAEAGDAQ